MRISPSRWPALGAVAGPGPDSMRHRVRRSSATAAAVRTRGDTRWPRGRGTQRSGVRQGARPRSRRGRTGKRGADGVRGRGERSPSMHGPSAAVAIRGRSHGSARGDGGGFLSRLRAGGGAAGIPLRGGRAVTQRGLWAHAVDAGDGRPTPGRSLRSRAERAGRSPSSAHALGALAQPLLHPRRLQRRRGGARGASRHSALPRDGPIRRLGHH